MKRIFYIILVAELVLVSLFTAGDLLYTFKTLQPGFLSKVIIFSICLLLIVFLLVQLLKVFFDKIWKIIIVLVLIVAYNFGLYQVNSLLLTYNGALANINKTSKYTTYLLAKKDSSINDKNDITSTTKIGIQSTTKSYENGSFALEEIEKLQKTENIKQYQSLKSAFAALNNGEVDLIASESLNSPAVIEIDEKAKSNYKEIAKFETDEQVIETNKDISKTPFTVLVSGVDSRSSNISDISNSDSNILVTFNPTTGQVTTLTTPRDSYVQLQCGGYSKDKLTHAAAYGGTKCVQNTLEKLYNVKIDYTVRINFVGVIDIVDALGGINVAVPRNNVNLGKSQVCEQNSHGQKDTICWTEGKYNHMNGETALAFARNRYNQDGGDFYRGRNQQIVIDAIIKKATKINNIGTVNKLMSAVSKHMKTNLSSNEILSLYDIMVGLSNGLNIEKLYIGGSTGMMNGVSYVFPSETDIGYASYRMQVVLEKTKALFPDNTFYVDGKKPYNTDGTNPLRQQKAPYQHGN